MRMLLTGSRTWDDADYIERLLRHYATSYPDLVVVHGACPKGADRIASDYCKKRKIKEEAHPADWEKYGKRAGFVRNEEMVRSKPDFCLAFIHNHSAGATHTVTLCRKYGVPVNLHEM